MSKKRGSDKRKCVRCREHQSVTLYSGNGRICKYCRRTDSTDRRSQEPPYELPAEPQRKTKQKPEDNAWLASVNLPSATHKELATDFKLFLKFAHKALDMPQPTHLQLDIADFLQVGPKRAIIEAYRGVGKSHITSLFVVWYLMCNPDAHIMVVSASKDRADQFSIFTRDLLRNLPGMQYLEPTGNQRDKQIAFDVAPSSDSQFPSVKSVGITGQITGSRADLIIADDVEIPNNSMTQPMRDKLSETVKEFDAILKPLPSSRIIYLGTPQCEDSLYPKLTERGYEARIWPARVPKSGTKVSYGDTLAPIIKGEPWSATDPQRFDEEELLQREASYGRSGFALQFMLNTQLSDAERYPLRVSDLLIASLDLDKGPMNLVYGKDTKNRIDGLTNLAMRGDYFYAPASVGETFAEWESTIMVIDPSGRGSDETAYAVGSTLNGFVFIRDAGGLQGGYGDSVLRNLALIAKAYKVNSIVTESNFGDGMFNQLLSPILQDVYPVSLEEVRSVAQKERRIIDTLEPVMNRHRLVIDEAVIAKDYETIQKYPAESKAYRSLIYQMTRVTRERNALRHDDRLDALAMLVAQLKGTGLGRDAEEGERLEKEAFLNGWAEGGLRFLMGRGRPTPAPERGRLYSRGSPNRLTR